VPAAWWTVLAAAGLALGPRAAIGVALGAALVVALSWHTARRFGGMTGDVIGAAGELATTAVLVALSTG
jgi:adenosylcobinamide-GDP ribazoletransferase